VDRVRYVKQREAPDFSFLNNCLARIREQRKLVYILTAAAFALSVVFALIIPHTYTAKAKVMPSMRSSPSSSINALLPGAAIFSQTASQVDLYQELLKCNQVKDSVLVQNGYGLWDEYRESQPPSIGYKEKRIRKAVSKTTFSGNYKSGVVTISTSSADRKLSADIANAFVDQLDLRLQELDRSMAAKVSGYFGEQVAEQRDKLREIEEENSRFLAKNRNYLSGDDPELRLEMERLGMNMEFNRRFLLTLLELKANNDLEVEKSVPRLVVIEWAKPPPVRSLFSRLKTMILSTVGAMLFAVGLIVLHVTYQWYIPQATRGELAHSRICLSQDAREVARRIRRPFRIPEQTGV